MIKKIPKTDVIKMIENNDIVVYYESYWEYPKTGDDEKTCPMLHAMFNIERKAGYIIHIPIKERK